VHAANTTYTKNQLDKLGNAIIFLCNKMGIYGPVSKTQVLKLVYILEEFSIRQWGTPFFGLHFKVWKMGPVSPDLYLEFTEGPSLLSAYIAVENQDQRTVVAPLRAFNDDEFSDQEMALLEQVAERFKTCTAKELINFTHRTNTPWYVTAQRHGLVDILESGQLNTTEIDVDFEAILEGDQAKLSRYHGYLEFLHQSQTLLS
jgi:uncharacterized phage-associated protein